MPLLRTLLRLIFPSWAFFDVAMAPPVLEVRVFSATGEAGPWRAAVQAPRRRWWHLVFNPSGTRALAWQTVVERWCDEHVGTPPNQAAAPGGDVTSTLLEHLAEGAARQLGAGAGWQWRIVVTEGAAPTVVAEGDRR